MAPVDLTGQVYVRDRRACFTGNYSSVFRGVYKQREVSDVIRLKSRSYTSYLLRFR
jgi:hypothetical protein